MDVKEIAKTLNQAQSSEKTSQAFLGVDMILAFPNWDADEHGLHRFIIFILKGMISLFYGNNITGE